MRQRMERRESGGPGDGSHEKDERPSIPIWDDGYEDGVLGQWLMSLTTSVCTSFPPGVHAVLWTGDRTWKSNKTML